MCNLPTLLNLQVVRQLNNEGRNSFVYIMYDPQLGTELVVKCIPKININNSQDYFTESSIIYEVEHPNIVKIQHASSDINNIYLSMPYYSNGSMEAMLNRQYLNIKDIISYSLDFLSGLHYVHTKGYIHFDIKPTNILFRDNGKAMLTDFGLAKYANNYGLAFPDKIYSSHISPEMVKGSLVSNQTDIYQSGMTLYRMCNGNENYRKQIGKYNTPQELENAVVNGKFPDRRFYLPHIPKRMRRIINKAININPDKRYTTVLDLMNDISNVDKGLNINYNVDENISSEYWEYECSSTHKHRISLIHNGKTYDIVGEKIRLLDNKKTFVNKYCSYGYSKRNDALKVIESYFGNDK